jgi:hypothetical protein
MFGVGAKSPVLSGHATEFAGITTRLIMRRNLPTNTGWRYVQAGRQGREINTERTNTGPRTAPRQVVARAVQQGWSIVAVVREQGVSPQRLYWCRRCGFKERNHPTDYIMPSASAGPLLASP